MDRLEDLEKVREGLLTRMVTCSSDQNYAMLVKTLMEVHKQIEELTPDQPRAEGEPAVVGEGVTAVDEFQRRLQARRAGSVAAS